MSDCALDRVTLAMVSLAANIAANHPKKGLCQLERLRSYGVPEEKIVLVVDVARHLRNEAGQILDHEFAAASAPAQARVTPEVVSPDGACCCSTTIKGNACC